METDWPTIRLGYEVLGKDVSTLAGESNVSEFMINCAIDSEDWKKQGVSALQCIPAVPETILVDTQSRLETLYTLAQSAFNGRYIELESMIISKALQITSSINSDDPEAAFTLDKVNSILAKLKEAAMLDGAQNRKNEADGSGAVTIQIMQNFGKEGEEKVDAAFAIEVAGVPQGTPTN